MIADLNNIGLDFAYSNPMATHTLDQNALFRRILENLNTAVLLLDSDLCLIYINPASEMLFALSAHRATGQRITKLFHNNRDFIANLERALTTSHPFTERELSLTLANGHEVTVDCTISPLTMGGTATYLLVELAQLDRQLRIAREESLLAQHRATRDVVRGLAHEIKNPLGGLRGAAQLLERELEHDRLKEYTAIIIGEADRLQNLLNRMLGPNTLPHKRWVNIHELLERVRQLVQAEAPPDVIIKRDYDPSVPELFADQDQLIQALLNLVRNAVQAIADQGGKVTLKTRVLRQINIGPHRHKLIASVQVIDDGPGIAPDMLDKIFYPMVTGRADGTGLGLPIAQALINQHNGLIECHSRSGQTVFTIMIPLENAHE